MKRYSPNLLLFGATICLASSITNAATPYKPFSNQANKEAKYYLGANIGSAKSKDICPNLLNCNNTAKSWKIYAGYPISDMLTIEGGYTKLGELGETNNNTTIKGLSASLIAAYPMTTSIKVFGRAGIFKQSTNNSKTTNYSDNIHPIYGIGADYELADGVALRGEWENYKNISTTNDNANDIQTISLGMTFSSL